MFWSKKNKQKQEVENLAKIVSGHATISYVFVRLTYGGLSENQQDLSKIIIYFFYDMYCAAVMGREPKNMHDFALIAGVRNIALKIFEQGGMPQLLLDSDTAEQTQFIHPKIKEFLETEPILAHLITSKIADAVTSTLSKASQGDSSGMSSVLSDLLSDKEILKTTANPVLPTVVKCMKCGTEETYDGMNQRQEAKLFTFKIDDNVRDDGLELFSIVCCVCGSITDYAMDPFNYSGNAPDGVEYFGSYTATSEDLNIAIKTAKELRAYQCIDKLKAILG